MKPTPLLSLGSVLSLIGGGRLILITCINKVLIGVTDDRGYKLSPGFAPAPPLRQAAKAVATGAVPGP